MLKYNFKRCSSINFNLWIKKWTRILNFDITSKRATNINFITRFTGFAYLYSMLINHSEKLFYTTQLSSNKTFPFLLAVFKSRLYKQIFYSWYVFLTYRNPNYWEFIISLCKFALLYPKLTLKKLLLFVLYILYTESLMRHFVWYLFCSS